MFAKSCLAQASFSAAGATTENEIKDLYRSGLLAGPLNGYCGRISPLESGLLHPQTVGNVDTEEMDWGSELRQILVSRQIGNLGTGTNFGGNRTLGGEPPGTFQVVLSSSKDTSSVQCSLGGSRRQKCRRCPWHLRHGDAHSVVSSRIREHAAARTAVERIAPQRLHWEGSR